jgi:sugar lactone lactonase YvrE
MPAHFPRATCTALACLLFTVHAQAQTSIEIYAGGSPFLNAGADTVPMRPRALALAPNGNLFVADEASGKILRYDAATSTVTSVPNLPGLLEYRFAGPQALGWDPGGMLNLMAGGEQWQLDPIDGFRIYIGPIGSVAFATLAADGSLYFTQSSSHAVSRRTPSGSIQTIAGGTTPGFSGDGTTTALLNSPRSVAVDAAGNVYIADTGNNRVRRRAAATGIITTVAGTGLRTYNGNNLLATQTNLSGPDRLTIDAAGNLYINEGDGYRIRKLNFATNRITNFAGNGSIGGDPGNGGLAINASINGVADIKSASDGTFYIAEGDSYRVRKVDPSGVISQAIGNGTPSFCGEAVPARQACLARPNGITIDDAGDVYVSDQNNRRVRKISAATGVITTIAGGSDSGPDGDGGPATAARFTNGTAGLAVDRARNLYLANNGRVRRIDAATGFIWAFAGTTTPGFSGDGGPAISARFNGVSRVALDASGNLYISDIYNNRVRRVDAATGFITTIAGNGSDTGPLGDGGPALMASLAWPHNLAFDAAGNLLIGDTNHYRIRKVNIATGVITTVAGNGNSDISGNGGPATAAGIGAWPAFDIDAGGNIYVTASAQLRRIDAQTGIIDAVPAPIWGLYTPEGRGLENPNDMVLGADNRLYITDAATNNLVLRVSGLPTAASDLTPPVIEPVLTGTAGANGWYRSDVRVTWNVTDPESAVTTTSGCQESQVTWDTEGTNFQCVATSSGGTANRSITVKRDTTAPTLAFGPVSPAPAVNGWNGDFVSIPFSTQDAMSGVYQTSTGSPLTFNTEGAGLTQQVTVMDFAGNTATFTSPAVNIDRTAPVIRYSISGTPGNGDWYRGDVVLTWVVDDTQSLISSSGCESTTIAADTTGTAFTCTATSSGGTNSQSVIIKRDATPPTVIFGEALPAADSNGWRGGPVGVSFEASDSTSGVASTSSLNPLQVIGTGAGVTAQLTVTDTAGNSATFTSPAFNIAASPPTVDYVVTGAAGTNGWYRGDVQLTWHVSEPDSALIGREGCDGSVIASDTAGTTFTCTASSVGGMTVRSVTIKRDATPPVLGFGSPTPVPNTNGWNKTDVSIPFTSSDALSGLATTSVASPLLLSTEGAATTGEVVVTDNAGNVATFTSVERNIDKTRPVVEFTTPADGATYGFYQDVVADYTCADVSLLSCTAPNPAGELINTRTAGARTFKVTAKDSVSFTTAVTHAFTVDATFNFDGFGGPIAAPPVLNLVSRGALVPIRWQLPDGHGGFVTNPASFVSATVGSLSCGSDPVQPLVDSFDGLAGLNYDESTHSFVYNWQTGASWTGCRKLTIKLRDSTTHELRFKFQ